MCLRAEKEADKRCEDLEFDIGRLQRQDRGSKREIVSLREQLEKEKSQGEQSLSARQVEITFTTNF